jgi:peptide/nickel transport system substrate-binding protein
VSHRRPYTYLLQFNMRHPRLRHAGLRRALNAAIDRAALVEDVLQGRGIPANGPVWPSHWAYDATVPGFRYEPRAVDGTPLRLSCIFADAALERLALTIQRQLLTIGVQLDLELMPVDDALTRVTSGAFDLFLADATHGPSLLRPYLFWRTAGRYNWGGFSSPAVDAALDSIRHAASDDAYRAGVAAFQRAIVEDPPAVFLAWSERARAVSTRFDVPVEPGRDVLSTLRLWRPAVEN